MPEMLLTVSIVQYDTDPDVLARTLQSLEGAARNAGLDSERIGITLVDNGGRMSRDSLQRTLDWPIDFRQGHGNIGYGQGHNLAADHVGRFHLVLNPDVDIAPDAIANALAFFEAHPDCGLITPKAHTPTGERQRLARRYPNVLDMALRGFAPPWLRERFRARLNRNDYVGELEEDIAWDPVLISGCFMFLRGTVWQQVGGFDPNFFLYFEDSDLTLRCARISRCAYVPSVRIVHHGGGAAAKGWRHIWLYSTSAFRFFNKHGWRLL